MKLVSIVFNKAASEYRLYYKDEETGKPYHITANHLLDKEKLWARGANYHQDPYRISWTAWTSFLPGHGTTLFIEGVSFEIVEEVTPA